MSGTPRWGIDDDMGDDVIDTSRDGVPRDVTQCESVEELLRSVSVHTYNKKAVLSQGNRAMPQVFFSVEVRQQHSLQV